MNTSESAQRRIAAWFDSTYLRKGSRYLRPLQGYMVYPELLGASPSDALLDVACGPGMLLLAASGKTEQLFGCDLSSVAVGLARSRVPTARVSVANAEALPYESSRFDLVTCLGSLERMLDRPRALAEMLRVGTPRARYCFLVRNSNTVGWKYLARSSARRPSRGHADADTLDNWTRLFESAGFLVRQVLPDQYPLLRRRSWRRFVFGPVDYRRPVASSAPVDRANEFVFLLGKQG
ncbi:MAG: class I SAM-dependent methyltransferase [Longimicrobiales bacterium]